MPPPLSCLAEQSAFTQVSSEPLLAFSEIAFERDDVPLFSGLSDQVAAGDILQIAGGNGSGKTTLLRILATALTATSGDLLWRGKPVARHRSEYLSELVFLGHSPGIKLALTPRENLLSLAKIYPVWDHDISSVLARVGLGGCEDMACHSLSAGQQRRVMLARLSMAAAPLWILDEPLTAIDQEGVLLVEHLLLEHADRGGAVILSSHQALTITGLRVLELADSVHV